jgi:hypothetical protein
MTAHNQWLPTTRSVLYWTTRVFSSTVTNYERRISAHTLSCLERRLSDECFHLKSQSHSYITTDGQPASLSRNKAPIWGLRPDLDYCLTVTGLLVWGAFSDERTGLPFAIAAGPCQRSLSRFRVPWNSRPYFAVSNLRLPFSSPATTRRVTVEVFDPASTRECFHLVFMASYIGLLVSLEIICRLRVSM